MTANPRRRSLNYAAHNLSMHLHFAYIDAGTGSMAIQLLLAGFLSTVYFLSSRWAALKKGLARRVKTKAAGR